MFKIESYVTPILLSYVDKYVRDFNPSDAQVSLWGGGVVLHNLVLKADVLQKEVSLPFTLVSGRIHELLIQVPWTKIMSEPITVTIDTIECVLSSSPAAQDETPQPEQANKGQVVEAPPGYMQALVRRIVSNIALKVHHLIVKYVQDDIILSLNVKHVSIDSTGPDWVPSFADIDQVNPILRRLVTLDNLTLCLDCCDSDGKIRYFQEPLLYRCQLTIRVLTKLISANIRRASCINLQVGCTKLAFGLTTDQMSLLLRLMNERSSPPATSTTKSAAGTKPLTITPLATNVQTTQSSSNGANLAEPTRSGSWSDWAWSWLPSWGAADIEEAPISVTPAPIYLSAFCDELSLALKVMEIEGGNRRRARAVLEFVFSFLAVKNYIMMPTVLRVRIGVRSLVVMSHGKCVCGHVNMRTAADKPTLYVSQQIDRNQDTDGYKTLGTIVEWKWPEEDMSDVPIETGVAVDEEFKAPGIPEQPEPEQGAKRTDETAEEESDQSTRNNESFRRVEEKPKDDYEKIWEIMDPIIFVEFKHERSPPTLFMNPYENTPADFQYSDWVEECKLDIKLVKPIELAVSTSLLHRLKGLSGTILKNIPKAEAPPIRTLTVEECEALSVNLPQRRINIEVKAVRVRTYPWDHSLTERPVRAPLVLDMELTDATVVITTPLYPYRVCSAACQMPEIPDLLKQAITMRVTTVISSIEIKICSPVDLQPKPLIRTALQFVTSILLNQQYFIGDKIVTCSYNAVIKELTASGSAPRFQAACFVLASLKEQAYTPIFKMTSLAKDALKDESAVALDMTIEDVNARGYITKNTTTHIFKMQALRVMALHSHKEGAVRQAWVLSAPDNTTSTPFLRAAFQWCWEPTEDSIDYLGVWTEPIAASLDPLLVAWLAYSPQIRMSYEPQPSLQTPKHSMFSSAYLQRRRTPPSSSGRGGSRSGSGTELVHNVRPRSTDSDSERPSDPAKRPVSAKKSDQMTAEELMGWQERLKSVLITAELGLIVVYVTTHTVDAVDCPTVRTAMEKYTTHTGPVLCISMGQCYLHSNVQTKPLWENIKYDGPAYVSAGYAAKLPAKPEGYPWKIQFADVTLHTLEIRMGSDIYGSSKNLRSQLKQRNITQRTMLEMVTTTVTCSIVSKTVQYKKHMMHKHSVTEERLDEKLKYFKTGGTFKPSTLKEFMRGPDRRKDPEVQVEEPQYEEETQITDGPVVAVGLHVHADTPPIVFRIEEDQVVLLMGAAHCFQHIVTLLQRQTIPPQLPQNVSQSTERIKSELLDGTSAASELGTESRSEMVQLFQIPDEPESSLSKFLWCQWVISRSAVVFTTESVRLVFQIEDVITSIDLQAQYNQAKIKIATAHVKYYKKDANDQWTQGAMSGRVLEARTPANYREDTRFLSVTITQAQISGLPPSWKEELHPKLLEEQKISDTMWEIYVMLAPLESIVEPPVLRTLLDITKRIVPYESCPLQADVPKKVTPFQWPYCYITGGGLRLIVAADNTIPGQDDAIIISFDRTNVNPHPDNPICRRPTNLVPDASWIQGASGLEGRQYEMVIESITIKSSQFVHLVNYEENESDDLFGVGQENPAHKWDRTVISPAITNILNPVDVGCVLAPPLYVGSLLACGAAVEVNLLADCAIDLSIEQISLVNRIILYTQRTLNEEKIVLEDTASSQCPYASIGKRPLESCIDLPNSDGSGSSLSKTSEMTQAEATEAVPSQADDSGVDTASRSSFRPQKKSVSVIIFDSPPDPRDYLEVFVTMGNVDISLLAEDVTLERSTSKTLNKTVQVPDPVTPPVYDTSSNLQGKLLEPKANVHNAINLGMTGRTAHRKHLCHISLYQPNMYYWLKKSQKTIQVNLFNAWIGLGAGPHLSEPHEVLMSTGQGLPDPITDIRPALATLKYYTPSNVYTSSATTFSSRATVSLDIERPVLFEISGARFQRVADIICLIQNKIANFMVDDLPLQPPTPPLYKLRCSLIQKGVETMIVHTSQVGLSGPEGAVGWDSAAMQLAVGARPERVVARALFTAASLAVGPADQPRRPALHPMQFGVEFDCIWEAWKKSEAEHLYQEPVVHLLVEFDRIVIDLCPDDLSTIARIQYALSQVSYVPQVSQPQYMAPERLRLFSDDDPVADVKKVRSVTDFESDHFYKDDLRSGAFKLVSGGQLPMAYQVMMNGDIVSWRYPHPRAVTRLVAFPLPDQKVEIECVLELFNRVLNKWEAHTYISLPVDEPTEINLFASPPEATFATIWRFRVHNPAVKEVPYSFNETKYLPRNEPLVTDIQAESERAGTWRSGVAAEQLAGALRVDSYFAPRALSRLRVASRLTALYIYLHNSLPDLQQELPANIEGYYISNTLIRSHRVISFSTHQSSLYAELGSVAGKIMLIRSEVSGDILDTATGTMEQLVDPFQIQGAIAVRKDEEDLRSRLRTSGIRLSLHIPRIQTLRALAVDWIQAYEEGMLGKPRTERPPQSIEAALEGRVSLWVHNLCSSALRIGQTGTDEVLTITPYAKVAYRWRCPTAEKSIRFSVITNNPEWGWSKGVAFGSKTTRVKLDCPEEAEASNPSDHLLYIAHVQAGSAKRIEIAGRLLLANMLRFALHYKVRVRTKRTAAWRALMAGELPPETIGRSAVCSSTCDLVLKVKFTNNESSWSGDIPLKECPKENVPWLVKVPNLGDLSYMAVWCRVVHARSSGRVLATIWPLYVLHSHLPLDIDILVVTEPGSITDLSKEDTKRAPLLQTAPGRGASTHLLAPGTTSARHSLSFQYRDIECPVTREAVPLHYGATDTSVFDKRSQVNHIHEVLAEIEEWLSRRKRGTDSMWPYSLVTKHWPSTWQPALLQPRSDVSVRYRAVRAGGGCSLELHLSPLVLVCNAAPVALTLRAHDAAPLCKLEPGNAIAAPSVLVQKPFFMSMEIGREAFVSGQLEVFQGEPGRYGTLPPGQVALDHSATFAIRCNHKVAFLTMYYEIIEDIRIIGITSTYTIINRLDTTILVTALVVPEEPHKDVKLVPQAFKLLQPTKEGSILGMSVCRFWLSDRWRGSYEAHLNPYLCVALPTATGAAPADEPVPVALNAAHPRCAVSLVDGQGKLTPAVITQHKHEGRWLVTVAPDPCPQYVVHNLSRHNIVVGEPLPPQPDTPPDAPIMAAPDCVGVKHFSVVRSGSMLHYSSPSYCMRHPASVDVSAPAALVIFATYRDDVDPHWCQPVLVADGEQLVAFQHGLMLKLRVETHLHTTLLDLQDFEQTDISASDIRSRLLNTPQAYSRKAEEYQVQSFNNLERMGAHETLIEGKYKIYDDVEYYSEVNFLTKIRQKESELREREFQRISTPSAVLLQSLKLPSTTLSYPIINPATTRVAALARFLIDTISLEISASNDIKPLFAVHIDQANLAILSFGTAMRTTLSVSDIQIDNLQYDSGLYDFAVVAKTRVEVVPPPPWPAMWGLFAEPETSAPVDPRLRLVMTHDVWSAAHLQFKALAEVEVQLGPIAVYLEDTYFKALLQMYEMSIPASKPTDASVALDESRVIQSPILLRSLEIKPIDLTLTLHTAVRMYIALDQSPLHLDGFTQTNIMTSVERLAHACTVHYLSATILGAGWVVGGLELLGAPGAMAARMANARGGVRGVATAAAAALVRSLSALAGSLARNLDLLAGDEEHMARAAAARRRPPGSLLAGLVTGLTNFAINILGAVGGLAHHPLVGVAVGESTSGAVALRRGLLGALTKPLSATADLVAYAGTGLLHQTGWDPIPQPRAVWSERHVPAGWRRDCVRWAFRLGELDAFDGFTVLLNDAHLQLLITHKFFIIVEPVSEQVVETIDLRFCTVKPFLGSVIELVVFEKETPKVENTATEEDEEVQANAAAMARVARYTGAAEARAPQPGRTLQLLPAPGHAHALHAALAAATHANCPAHFALL